MIVAGGAGAGDPDGWSQIAELAQLLKAGLASTRPAVDFGMPKLTLIGRPMSYERLINPRSIAVFGGA